MKKNSIKKQDPKKIAIIALIISVVILTIMLLSTIADERREPVSEVIELSKVIKDSNLVITEYKAYKNFLKDNKLEGNLNRSNFRTSNYILLVGEFSKDDKINDIAISDVQGINVSMEFGEKNKKPTAYFIPVPKSKKIAGFKVIINKEN